MAGFMLRFLFSNLLISCILLLLILFRMLLKHTLTSRMQYHLWYVMFGLLSVPFLPFPVTGFPPLFSWIGRLRSMASAYTANFTEGALYPDIASSPGALQDFALSAGGTDPSAVGMALSAVWLTGILLMLLLMIRSRRHFWQIRQSALPLQNKEIQRLYRSCLKELRITADIPIYSTAFLKSPVIAGTFRPCIYLPIHLISDCPTSRLRYMLLHELQHFRHKDTLAGCLMDLVLILYWFNPMIWYALREMRSDREIACDAAVLDHLKESDRRDYGYTLLELAERYSPASFSSAVSISGSMRQMQKRILHIASYEKSSLRQKVKGYLFFCILAALLSGLAPALSTRAADRNIYRWDTSSKNIFMIDLSSCFHEYTGSFVLYDLNEDIWKIYNMDHALLRTSPDSTYKIYDALFGLEEQIITPQDSFMAWDGRKYPFDAWNADQDLHSAMQSSVNWYFQKIDEQLGRAAVRRYIRRISYGNEAIRADLSSYWMESSLKISPVEQVLLLKDLYQNRFDFAPEHTESVKNSICLLSSGQKSLYGKTGTGRVDGQDISGWFIGFMETDGNTFFFATRIQKDEGASGSRAARITLSVLAALGL